MTMNQLHNLEACGQSVWTDVISREIRRSGTLARYIEEDGITGVTANPAIFEKAIVGSHDYDETIGELGRRGLSPDQIYQALAIENVGAAGVPAIASLIADGLNVNITLIFAVDMYERVMEAYLQGLERRLQDGQPVDRIVSVASFFVSRVDTVVDTLLDGLMQDADPEQRVILRTLRGKGAIANAAIAYQRFERIFTSPRFEALALQGARVQRPLWASTGIKNPHYSYTMYVMSLIGPNTVNTMTLDTIDAFRDHGEVDCKAICRRRDETVQVIDDLEKAGIDLRSVTDRLTIEGVLKFNASLDALRAAIGERRSVFTRA